MQPTIGRVLSRRTATVAACLCLLSSGGLTADQFVLKSGARIRGEWVNRHERPVTTYVIRLASGGQVSLHRSQIEHRQHEGVAISEYEGLAPSTADTIEQQWQLAEWCREQGLRSQRERHLRRIIELDSKHVKAWRGLGYSQIDGQWVKREDVLTRRGYVYFDGRWRLPEEVTLINSRREAKRVERGWLARIKLWRGQLNGVHHDEAMRNLLAIREPIAVRGINSLLTEETERDVRLLFVEILGQIPGEQAAASLIIAAMNHADEEVFFEAIQQLDKRQNPHVIGALAQNLKVQDNAQVNRAANALGQLGDQQAIEPLIDALVTTHEQRDPNAQQGGMNFMFSKMENTGVLNGCANPETQTLKPGQVVLYGPQEGIGMTANQPTTRQYQVVNQEALDALVKLTGVSFGFDKQAWRTWLGARKKSQRNTQRVSTRRQ